MKLFLTSAISGLMLVSACTSSGTAERNAAYGAAAGAAAGAVAGEVIAGRPGRGAAYGAAIGAVGGAIVGCERSNECWNRARNNGAPLLLCRPAHRRHLVGERRVPFLRPWSSLTFD